jgi:hypothetical protein
MSSTPLYEYKHFVVPKGGENKAIKYLSKFHWELVQTQKIDYTKFHLESDYPDMVFGGVQEIRSVNERIEYTTIDMRRNKRMPNYDKIVELENEYNSARKSLNLLSPPKNPSDVLEEITPQKLGWRWTIAWHLAAFLVGTGIGGAFDNVTYSQYPALSGIIVFLPNIFLYLSRKYYINKKEKALRKNPDKYRKDPRYIEAVKKFENYKNKEIKYSERLREISKELSNL